MLYLFYAVGFPNYCIQAARNKLGSSNEYNYKPLLQIGTLQFVRYKSETER